MTSAFTHRRGRASIKRQQSVVAAECALVRFVDAQSWWSCWLEEGCLRSWYCFWYIGQYFVSETMRSINTVVRAVFFFLIKRRIKLNIFSEDFS